MRYAVVGLGHIAQVAVLPAFKNARKNSELVALVSDDELKLKELGRKYRVDTLYRYRDFEQLMQSGEVDAVYIATPNNRHQEFVEVAAENGVHVLCEKPLATDSDSCRAMIKAADRNYIKLMTAYRLHFDDANLKCIELAKSGKLGDLKIFNSVFSFNIGDPDNIRLKRNMGGGPLFDIGIYCVNAARYLFQSEPTEISAIAESGNDSRFGEVDEMVSVSMKFPDHRLATFTVSFGAADSAEFDLLGTKGRLRLENAYEYSTARKLHLQIGDNKKTMIFGKHDQFSAELIYFSDCVLKDHVVEPSGEEGLIDIEIIEAIQMALDRRESVPLDPDWKAMRPNRLMRIVRPGIRRPPEGVHVTPPSG